jgi:hypothetical protein
MVARTKQLEKAKPKPYPKRPPFFALHYLRWVIDSGMTYRIGSDGLALLTVIVNREDAIHYYRAPDYFNEQLTKECGIKAISTMIRVRKRVVKEGLLEYFEGTKGVPGIYFVTGFPSKLLEKAEGKRKESEMKAEGKRKESVNTQTPSHPFPSLNKKTKVLGHGRRSDR